MLESCILKYLIEQEGRSNLVNGRVAGWSLAHFRDKYNVPKTTFYRAVNTLVKFNMIHKQKRDYYVLSSEMRSLCNKLPDDSSVRI